MFALMSDILARLMKKGEMAENDLRIAVNRGREEVTKLQKPAIMVVLNGMVEAGFITTRDSPIPNTGLTTKYYIRVGDVVHAAGLWWVVHQALSTDTLVWTGSLVLAATAEEALAKYNALAKKRKDYPYCWTQADSATAAEIVI